jgi:hypothetical protein
LFHSSQYPIMTKQKQLKYHTFTWVFRPFTQYFVEAPLAEMTALHLLGYDASSLAHLYLGSFSYSSLQILSSFVRLDGECHCTAIFRSLQRCSMGFKSGLWLGHSGHWDLSQSHSCVVLAVCLGSMSCWKVNLPGSQRSGGLQCSGAGFHQVSLCTLLRYSLPRSWLVSQSLPLNNITTALCCQKSESRRHFVTVTVAHTHNFTSYTSSSLHVEQWYSLPRAVNLRLAVIFLFPIHNT